MLFHVSGEFVEPGPLLPPEQLVQMVEQAVIPSLERWAALEQEGKVKAGGVFAGERAGAFIVEAASAEEMGELLSSLPFWGLIKWQVRPMQSIRSTVDRERRAIEQVKAMGQAGR